MAQMTLSPEAWKTENPTVAGKLIERMTRRADNLRLLGRDEEARAVDDRISRIAKYAYRYNAVRR